jgi:hypothetical protein
VSEPTRTGEPDPPPGSGLTAALWALAVLLAAMELVWWYFDRLYSS